MTTFAPEDFEILYPGVFSEREKKLAEQYLADNRALEERGPIDPRALAAGQVPPDTPGIGPSLVVTEDMVRYNNSKYDPENPLLHDAEYARRLGYKDILAMPCFGAHDDTFMVPYPPEARDTLLVSQLNHSVTTYRPIYPGDTLYLVTNRRTLTDLTPQEGSIYRHLVIRSEGSVYNQRGEKVNDTVWRVMESIKVFKPGRRPAHMTFADIWEAPEWTRRPAHYYTDQDWETIIDLWSNEKRRGEDPLYWEDVEIGEQPAWTVDGPIIESVMPTTPYGMGTGGSRTLRKEILDPVLRQNLVRGEADGIYRTPNPADQIPPVPENQGVVTEIPSLEEAGAVDTRDIHKGSPSARAPLINFMGRDIAIRHINNWMGDRGWLYNIRWGIMPPETMAAYGKPVPANPDAPRFLDAVPHMRGRYAEIHGLTGDLAIVKSYVYAKYVQDGHFLVDLAWWIETITGEIWLTGGATVRLPSRRV
ncbi:MAG: MaoC family dehydratase N-terminal domain-containing protein [Thermoleophilia bacterium]|nr:MaoC family dehydratase N-terminal domain-containing protein [Thermoleophilia bacterium]